MKNVLDHCDELMIFNVLRNINEHRQYSVLFTELQNHKDNENQHRQMIGMRLLSTKLGLATSLPALAAFRTSQLTD